MCSFIAICWTFNCRLRWRWVRQWSALTTRVVHVSKRVSIHLLDMLIFSRHVFLFAVILPSVSRLIVTRWCCRLCKIMKQNVSELAFILFTRSWIPCLKWPPPGYLTSLHLRSVLTFPQQQRGALIFPHWAFHFTVFLWWTKPFWRLRFS